MKAIQAVDHGSYEALRLVDIPRPQPRSGQALIRITSAGVTPLDRYVLVGALPTAKPPPMVLGNEGAGVVVEDPTNRFVAGDRVLFFAGPGGVTQDGTWAEYALVPAGNLAHLPNDVSDEVAGGLPIAYLERVPRIAPSRLRRRAIGSGAWSGRKRRQRDPQSSGCAGSLTPFVNLRKRRQDASRCR